MWRLSRLIKRSFCDDTLWGSVLRAMQWNRNKLPSQNKIYLYNQMASLPYIPNRPWSSVCGVAYGSYVGVNLEMHSKVVIEYVWRCTCRLWSSKIVAVLVGSRYAGRYDGSWDSIHCLTLNCGNAESWVQQHLPRDGKLDGSGGLSIFGWCCTWCVLYSVVTHDHGIKQWEGWLNFVFSADGRVEAQGRERSEEMREIIMRNWDLENLECQSIYHLGWNRYKSWSSG